MRKFTSIHILTPVLQTLSVRLGATTGTSLPHQTRKLFLGYEAKYPKYRVPIHCGLWVLYILAEIAIIATDLAELLGSAIALNLLFPRLPLYGGVLVTAADVLIVLAFFNSRTGRQGMMFFEILIVSLVSLGLIGSCSALAHTRSSPSSSASWFCSSSSILIGEMSFTGSSLPR